MLRRMRRLVRHTAPLLLATLLAACRPVPPVTYEIPPGLSASFPPDALKTNKRYQQAFCSVLAERIFDGDGWKECKTYVDMPSSLQPQPLKEERLKGWTLLLVGGFGAQCFSPTVVAFEDAAEHLDQYHDVGYHVIDVNGFGSSEDNAELIVKKVKKLSEKRFIAVTHSKGAADFMVALTKYPDDLKRVKGLVTIAGAVGGSWLVDDFIGLNNKVLRGLLLNKCEAPKRLMDNGLDSMRRDTRQKFLASVPHNWRAYSVSAVSKDANTSDVLKPLWNRVAPYAKEQDSHIVEREALVPRGEYLGRALADHWAVAMPFTPNDKIKDKARRFVDRRVQWNRFPRAPLVEAAVRIVTEDIPRPAAQ
jgi:pimeloyl-ACP methyl ester carboxylesterase